MLFACQLRDYSQELEALITSKPNKVTVEMFGMFQDHISRAIQKVVTGTGDVSSTEVEDAEEPTAIKLGELA